MLFVQTNLKVDKDSVIFVFAKGCLHAVSSIDGDVLWKKDFATERFACPIYFLLLLSLICSFSLWRY